jgi:uncharacterized protein YuzE
MIRMCRLSFAVDSSEGNLGRRSDDSDRISRPSFQDRGCQVKISYHPDTDSLYIHLSEIPSVDSDEVAPDFVLDFDSDGQVVGIEVQHASKSIDLKTLEATSLPIAG